MARHFHTRAETGRIFEIEDVAKILGVPILRASAMFDSERIGGYLNDFGERRIPQDKLEEYLAKSGTPELLTTYLQKEANGRADEN